LVDSRESKSFFGSGIDPVEASAERIAPDGVILPLMAIGNSDIQEWMLHIRPADTGDISIPVFRA
jgi:hypothetical protein